jgi:hypothetical protein
VGWPLAIPPVPASRPLGTAVQVGGATKAGVAFYVVSPRISAGSLGASLLKQGQFGVAGNHLTYPNVGVTTSGRGVITFTLVGADHYPSAAFAGLDTSTGAGPVQVAREGLGPADGFSSYKAFVGNPPRTRWGDYGATAVDGNNIWIASEYIAQTCTLAQWLIAPIGSCGGTRTSLANWATRISLVTPKVIARGRLRGGGGPGISAASRQRMGLFTRQADGEFRGSPSWMPTG